MEEFQNNKVEESAKKIKLLILDVDGVLTDGRIIYDDFGNELKFFNVRDGLGLSLLYRAGIKTIIITARKSKSVLRRAKECHIDKVYQNSLKKIEVYKGILKRLKLKDEEVAFIGDDIPDLAILKRAGLAVTVPDAAPEVKNICHLICAKSGGQGAVRELVEIILKSQGRWEEALARFNGK